MITGQESVLKAALISAIRTAVQTKAGTTIKEPEYIDAVSEGIANAIIPFLVANIQVNPGQVTLSAGITGPTAPPGSPTPIPALPGAVTTPGTIS